MSTIRWAITHNGIVGELVGAVAAGTPAAHRTLEPGEAFFHDSVAAEAWTLAPDLISVEIRDAVDVARAARKVELDARRLVSLRSGLPLADNGNTFILRYEPQDIERWATWSPGLTPPPGGLLVRLLVEFNGKLRLAVVGTPKLTAAKEGIATFVNAVDINAGTLNDALDAAATVPAVNAVDLDSGWPSNTIPL